MESSKSLGVTEECSSSESGWTMYIASPVHEHNDSEVDDDGDDGDKGDEDDGDDHDHDHDNDKSDDSLASDASSGPSYRETLHGKKLNKKPHKQVEKKINDKIKGGEKKEELGRKANKAGGFSYGYRGGKVTT